MKHLETFLKLIIIGMITTFMRLLFQGIVPPQEMELLWPSIFADEGLINLAFMVFGSVFYTLLATLYLLAFKRLEGGHLSRSLKYVALIIAIWSIYILEPMPHRAGIVKLWYILADGGALLIMGLLLGVLIGSEEGKFKSVDKYIVMNKYHTMKILAEEEIEEADKKGRRVNFSILNVFIIGLIFFIGRVILHEYIGVYSSYGDEPIKVMVWALIGGGVIGSVYELILPYIWPSRYEFKFLSFSILFFGLILVVFHGFIPIIYRFSIKDLILRVLIDVGAVSLGGAICLGFDYKKLISKKEDYILKDRSL